MSSNYVMSLQTLQQMECLQYTYFLSCTEAKQSDLTDHFI
jgi:hypothetical protein